MSTENQNKIYDGRNRCKRCNRPLSDPNDIYGWRCAQIVGFDQYQKIASILDENALKEYNAYTLKYLGKNANLPNSNPRPIKFGIDAKGEYYYMRELLGLD